MKVVSKLCRQVQYLLRSVTRTGRKHGVARVENGASFLAGNNIHDSRIYCRLVWENRRTLRFELPYAERTGHVAEENRLWLWVQEVFLGDFFLSVPLMGCEATVGKCRSKLERDALKRADRYREGLPEA